MAERFLTDSHCHLDLIRDPVATVLEHAKQAGVGRVMSIGIDLVSSRGAVALASCHDEVYATVGLHPHDAEQWDSALAAEMHRLAQDERVVAIGECGLDYYRDLSPRESQREAFCGQMELARRLGKPLVVHIREAADHALDLLERHAEGLTVILHCFSQPDDVEVCVERGYFISFAGNVTYKTADELRKAARAVPDDRIMVETDAPYLTPVPYRGTSNLPQRVVHTAALLAEIRGEDGRAFAELTTANARRAFGIPEGGLPRDPGLCDEDEGSAAEAQ